MQETIFIEGQKCQDTCMFSVKQRFESFCAHGGVTCIRPFSLTNEIRECD